MTKFAESPDSRRIWYVILFSLALFAGCGGGGGGGSSSAGGTFAQVPDGSASPAPNVLPITVTWAPGNFVNRPLASVTICAPGSDSDCQTIDGILIDTGSTGLRIPASVVSALPLRQQTDAAGNSIAECSHFAEGFIWGSVKIADVRIAGEQANSLPIQVIGDPDFGSIPISCSNTGRSMSTPQALGANGYLGVSAFRHDCGIACAQSGGPGIYYACPASGCRPVPRPLAEQVTNPVSMFARNNNGVIVRLPAVPATGSASVDGSLLFGIGTQKNNSLGNASIFTLSPVTWGVTTFFDGNTFDQSYIDTGSNANFFWDASIPACSSVTAGHGFDCPLSTRSLSATIQGMNGTNASVSFTVANADSLQSNSFAAFGNLAGPTTWSSLGLNNFNWGLPFFFGRSVFVAIEGADVPGTPGGPFVAF